MSATLENAMVSGLGGYYTRQERRDALAESAYVTLRDELVDALMLDPAREVSTPGFGKRRSTATAIDVIGEAIDSRGGEQVLHELLRIVAMCAAGRADHELHLRASAWIAARAAAHAAYHVDDLVAEIEEGDA